MEPFTDSLCDAADSRRDVSSDIRRAGCCSSAGAPGLLPPEAARERDAEFRDTLELLREPAADALSGATALLRRLPLRGGVGVLSSSSSSLSPRDGIGASFGRRLLTVDRRSEAFAGTSSSSAASCKVPLL